MNFKDFQLSLNQDDSPKDISPDLLAMWLQAKGDWDAAHRLAQSQKSSSGNWIHAHLHRAEGDKGNAAYWYRLAGKPVCTSRLNDEWKEIVMSLVQGE